jgi:hypothetical protein
MLAAGSFKSSKWGYSVYKPSNNSFNSSHTFSSPSSNYGLWSTPTLGPDGFIYMMPTSDLATVNGAINSNLQGVLIVNPNSSNSQGNIKYENPTSVYSNLGDVIPVGPSPTAYGNRVRFASKGILAPNGKIYFIGLSQKGVVILTPNGFSSTWQYKTFDQMLGATAPSGMSFSGGVLGQDGKIYLIPTGTATARIDPATDTMSYGYWNGSIGKRWNAGTSSENGFGYPRNSSGSIITPPANVDSPNSATNKLFNGFKDAISHPNGKIYLFPYDTGGTSRWIFILDPANWGTNHEIHSASSLAFPISPDPTAPSGADGVFGTCENIFLEKRKSGQSLTTLKIYAMYYGNGNGSYSSSIWNDNYPNAKIIRFDPTDNTWTLVGNIINLQSASNNGMAARPAFQLPNGHIVSMSAFTTGSVTTANVITGDSVDTIKFPNLSSDIVGSLSELSVFNTTYGNPPQVNGSYGGGVILTGQGLGKNIFSGGMANSSTSTGGSIVSVKGYYPGIKYFDSTFVSDLYTIPSDLSVLTTSRWNSYCNKPF